MFQMFYQTARYIQTRLFGRFNFEIRRWWRYYYNRSCSPQLAHRLVFILWIYFRYGFPFLVYKCVNVLYLYKTANNCVDLYLNYLIIYRQNFFFTFMLLRPPWAGGRKRISRFPACRKRRLNGGIWDQ